MSVTFKKMTPVTKMIPVIDIRNAYESLGIKTTFNQKSGKLTIYSRKSKVLYAVRDMGTWYVID